MGCSSPTAIPEDGQSTAAQSPDKKYTNEEKKVVKKKIPCFGVGFSEEELYQSDPELLNSEEMKISIQKWDSMCKERSDLTVGLAAYYNENGEIFLKNLKKGPPPKYRWASWKTVLQVDQVYKKDVYTYLISPDSESASSHLEKIKTEAKKVFSYYFEAEQADYQRSMTNKLEKALVAISIYCTDIGYNPSVGYILGFLLMLSGLNDEEAFWTFIAIINDKLVQDPLKVYGLNGIYIEYSVKADFFRTSFIRLFENQLPDLKRHFDSVKILDSHWILKWFLDIFLSSFSFKYCLRFWDYIMSYGFSGLFKISLAILVCTKDKFIGNDLLECTAILNSFGDGENLPPPDEILKIADDIVIDINVIESAPKDYNGPVYGMDLIRKVTYEVDRSTGMMAGIEDEPEIKTAKSMQYLDTASRLKLKHFN